jgi:hypothetical protein
MMMRRLFATLLLLASMTWANTCASTQAGNWSAAATWTSCGGGIPGNGDTATVGHAVTVDVDTTVGTSPSNSTTFVLTINAPLTIATAKTLTVRGGIVLDHNLILSAGAGLTMDPTQAADRTLAEYIIGPDNNSKFDSRLVGTACTAVARCTVKTLRTNGDEARARASMDGYYYGGNQLNVKYTDFIDLGSAADPAWVAHNSNFVDSSMTFSIEDSTVTRCGAMDLWSLSGDSIIRINRTTFTSSLQSYNVGMANSTAMTAGERSVVGSYFDQQLGETGGWALQALGFTIQYNVMHAAFLGGGFGPVTQFDSNVVIGQSTRFAGNITNSVFLSDVAYNPHYIEQTVVNQALLADGNIIQTIGTAVDGDGIIILDNNHNNLTIKNTLILPRTDGALPSSALVSTGAAIANQLMITTMEHNTLMTTGSFPTGMFYNECGGACTPAGTFAAYKSNLAWTLDALTTFERNHSSYQGTPNDNVLGGADATNNTCWGCLVYAGTGPASGTYYSFPLSVGQDVPGANDLNLAPGFADKNRSVETWAATKGQAATLAGFESALKTNPTSLIPDLLNYIRAGFAPTNVALATAAHDGTWIGAVKPVGLFGAF